MLWEKTLESPLNCEEIKPVHPKGNQSWMFIGRTDAEAETPILWPPDAKNWFPEKDPDAGKDWRQEEKEMTEDETVGWHHQFDGHEFEQAPGVGNGQGSLTCCSPWGRRVEHDWATEINWTVDEILPLNYNLNFFFFVLTFIPLTVSSVPSSYVSIRRIGEKTMTKKTQNTIIKTRKMLAYIHCYV